MLALPRFAPSPEEGFGKYTSVRWPLNVYDEVAYVWRQYMGALLSLVLVLEDIMQVKEN